MSATERLGIGLIVAGATVLLAHRARLGDYWALLRGVWRARRLKTPHGNSAPAVIHAVLPPSATAFRRVIIVGDIHGCPEELQALLDKLGYRRGVDLLLSVGDLVNKGPDSEKVLQMAVDAGMQAVRGNHDDSAYEAFRCWLDGKDMPKPAKHGWVAGLDAGLADYLAGLPFTMQLPAYGVVVVHAGLVPGLPLHQQLLFDMSKMRDVVPGAEEAAADAAAAAVAAAAPLSSLPDSSFDWHAAVEQLAAEAAAERATSARAGGGTVTAAGASSSSSSGTEAMVAAAVAAGRAAPRDDSIRLVGREVPNPLGRAWASIWQGPQHVVFGHDAKRRLQLHRAATGIDTGCVYGGQLAALVLPPLDDQGQLLEQRLNLPPDAQEIALASGLPAYLVQVPAKLHSDKFLKKAEQQKGRLQEMAKEYVQHHHVPAELAQQAQQPASAQHAGHPPAGAGSSSAEAGPAKSAAHKKDD